jgi:hypothetical protein
MAQIIQAEMYILRKAKMLRKLTNYCGPTDFNKKVAGNTDKQKRLYRLIWQRAVASQMTDANTRNKISANVESESLPNFL